MKYILTIILLTQTLIVLSQNKIIVKVDTSAKIQHLTTNGNAGNIGITGGNSLTLNVNDMDSIKTNEGLMTLTGTTAPYTYSSNTTGSTDLILQQGTNTTIVRSGNTLTFNSSGGGGGGGTYTAGSGINIDGSNVISNTRDISKSGNNITLSNGGSTIGIASNTPTSGQVLKWNGSNWVGDTDLTGGGGGGSGTVTSVAIANGGGINVISGSPITTNGTITLSTVDQSVTNELITSFTKPTGNVIRIVDAGATRDINIATNTPSEGQVLKWVSNQWQGSTDLTGGGGGGSTYTSGAGIDVNNTLLTISALDISPNNEIDKIGISTSLVGGGRLMNYTDGFSNGTGTQLIITGSTASVSTSSNGGSITWTLPDASATNEAQTLTGNANTISLDQISGTAGGTVSIAKSGTASDGKVLKWLTGQWVYGDDNNSTYSGGTGISISGGNVISATDASLTNELVTSFTKNSGNVIRLTDAGGNKDVSISNNTPYAGSVLKWDGTTSQWLASDDLTSSGGGGGGTYTAGTGISISGTDVISNTGDLSATNEAQTLTSSGNTFILNAISGVGGGTVSIAKSGTASNGKVLKYNGTDWVYGDDENTTYTAGTGLNLSGTQFTAVDNSITNEGLMSLSGASAPYTYNSNTNVSTPLIITSGAGVSITRSTNTLTFASTITDTDNQNLGSSASGTNRTITITGGTSTTINVADNDNDSNNEIQSLTLGTLSGGQLPINPTLGGTGINITQGSGIELVRNSANQFTINNTSLNTDTDNQNLGSSANGTDRTITITGGTSTTINVADNDNSLTNEGSLSVGAGTGTTSIINSNTSGSTGVTITAGTGLSISENGNVITLANTVANTDNNIYNVNGTLTGTRTVTQNNLGLTFNHNTSGTQRYVFMGPILGNYGFLADGTGGVIRNDNVEGEGVLLASGQHAISANSNHARMSHGGNFGDINLGKSLSVNSTQSTIQFNTNRITLNTSGFQFRINGNEGTNGQVLTSNGTNATWQTPAAPALDGIATTGTNYASVSNNGDLPLFGGGSSASVSSVSGNGFIKGVSSGIYEVNVVVNPTSADANGFVELGLYISPSTLIHKVKLYNYINNNEVAGDVIYTFVTNTSGGTFVVRNTSGAARDFDIKRVTVKRVL